MLTETKQLLSVLSYFFKNPRKSVSWLRSTPFTIRGAEYARTTNFPIGNQSIIEEPNRLRQYFDANKTGRGIWKWEHYFEIYQKHFSKFVGKKVNILEIGIYSGGSLKMWKDYFGENCMVYGVDIEKDCKVYEEKNVTVFIGDQEDPSFWDKFKKEVPEIDIIIDDGGHQVEQRIVTLQQLLPYLNPGGVYLCEDIQGTHNYFNSYAAGLTSQLNSYMRNDEDTFQSAFHSVHFYPLVTVIEKRDTKLLAPVLTRMGTEWQPFKI